MYKHWIVAFSVTRHDPAAARARTASPAWPTPPRPVDGLRLVAVLSAMPSIAPLKHAAVSHGYTRQGQLANMYTVKYTLAIISIITVFINLFKKERSHTEL